MRRAGRWTGLGVLAALAAYGISGAVVVVAPGEMVVVRRLGRVLDRPWGPGLHWGLPIPLERRDRVRIAAVRRVEIGLAGVPGPRDDPSAGEFLTGDRNLVSARAVVQYRVVDPVAYALRVGDLRAGASAPGDDVGGGQGVGERAVEALLGRLAGASLARAVVGRGIDDVLGPGRVEVAGATREALARSADRLGLGLAILGVSLTDARPPIEVAPAFAEVQAARSTHERRLQEAATYATTTRTAARAEAEARVQHAGAVADRTVALARAGAGRFEDLLAEAGQDRALTVRRLYLDALRVLLPGVRRSLVLTPDEPLDLSILNGDDQSP